MCPTKCQVAQADEQERIQKGLFPPECRQCTIISCLQCPQRCRRRLQACHAGVSTSRVCCAELACVLSTAASSDLLQAVKACSPD